MDTVSRSNLPTTLPLPGVATTIEPTEHPVPSVCTYGMLPDVEYHKLDDLPRSSRRIFVDMGFDMVVAVPDQTCIWLYFVVSAKISAVSPILEAWVGAADIPSKGPLLARLSLNGTDPQAFHIVALLAHGMPTKLPETVSAKVLFELAKFCNEFKTTAHVLPWTTSWTEHLLPAALETGSIQWLYVAYVFQYPALFNSHLHHAVCTARKELLTGKLDLEEDLPSDGRVILDTIRTSREELLLNILSVCDRYCEEKYFKKKIKCRANMDQCAHYVFVTFLNAMRKHELWPKPPKASECYMSPVHKREELLAVEIDPYPIGNHEGCSDLHAFKADILCQSYTCPMEGYTDHFKEPALWWSTSPRGTLPFIMGSRFWNTNIFREEDTFAEIYNTGSHDTKQEGKLPEVNTGGEDRQPDADSSSTDDGETEDTLSVVSFPGIEADEISL